MDNRKGEKMRFIILIQGLIMSAFIFRWNRAVGIISAVLSCLTFTLLGVPAAGIREVSQVADESMFKTEAGLYNDFLEPSREVNVFEHLKIIERETASLDKNLKELNSPIYPETEIDINDMDDARLWMTNRCSLGMVGYDPVSRGYYLRKFCGV